MAAVRAEVPGISVAFASIGFGHSVLVLSWEVFWANFRAIVEKHNGETREMEKATSGNCLFVVKLKRGQSRPE